LLLGDCCCYITDWCCALLLLIVGGCWVVVRYRFGTLLLRCCCYHCYCWCLLFYRIVDVVRCVVVTLLLLLLLLRLLLFTLFTLRYVVVVVILLLVTLPVTFVDLLRCTLLLLRLVTLGLLLYVTVIAIVVTFVTVGVFVDLPVALCGYHCCFVDVVVTTFPVVVVVHVDRCYVTLRWLRCLRYHCCRYRLFWLICVVVCYITVGLIVGYYYRLLRSRCCCCCCCCYDYGLFTVAVVVYDTDGICCTLLRCICYLLLFVADFVVPAVRVVIVLLLLRLSGTLLFVTFCLLFCVMRCHVGLLFPDSLRCCLLLCITLRSC